MCARDVLQSTLVTQNHAPLHDVRMLVLQSTLVTY